MTIQRPSSKQPLPASATQVFHGVVFDVYQWEQEDYDGNIKIFEKLVRPDTAIVLPVTEDGRIIYSIQEQPGKEPFLSTIGGRIDEGEDGLEAARRELLEETGYEAEEWELLEAAHPTTKIDWCIYTFVARGCHRVKEQSLDGGEKIDLRFASFEEFIEIVTQQDFAEEHLKIRFLEAKLDPDKMKELKRMFGQGK